MNGWRCPAWCAKGHQCTAQTGSPSGVHASEPMRWNTAYGSLVAVRFQNVDGRNWIELRATASLDHTGNPRQEQASQLAVQVDLAIRNVVLPSVRKKPAIVQKGQPK